MRISEITKSYQPPTKSYQPPTIDVGDEVLVGKFRNRRAEVTGFAKDDHHQPVLKTTKGDQKLFKPRIAKLDIDESSLLSEIEIGGVVDSHHLDDIAGQHDYSPRQGVLWKDFPSEPDLPKDMELVGRLGELYITCKHNIRDGVTYYLFFSGKPVAYVAVQSPNASFGDNYPGRNAHNPDIEGVGLRVVSIYLDPVIRGQGNAVALYYWLLKNKCDYILPDDLQTRGGVFIWRQLLTDKKFEVVVFNSAKHDFYSPRPGATWAQIYKSYNLYPFVTLAGKADRLIQHDLESGDDDMENG